MTIVLHDISNQSANDAELRDQLSKFDFVIGMKFPTNGTGHAEAVALAPPGFAILKPKFPSPGTTVPELPDKTLVLLPMPDKSVRYCLTVGGTWYWTGLTVTDA